MRNHFPYKSILTALLVFLQSTFLSAQDGYIKGKVTNGRESLPAATVSLGNQTMLTNTNGEFSFSVKAGTYILMITHVGYKIIKEPVSVKAGATQIFNYTLTPDEQMGEVVVVGSRSSVPRSNLNTVVPVDVFSFDKLRQTGQLGIIQMLNYLVPSFNAGRQVLNEPVTLRGLGPDHLLILLNGNRYHNSAYLNNGTPKSNLGRGSVANDLNSIPFSAIENIEILRDGASAQYGSDAIAGIINIQLKELTGKLSLQSHIGQFYAGDGLKTFIGINKGFAIRKGRFVDRQGFLNCSADFRYQGPTTRAGEYKGTVYTNDKAKDDSIINARGINKKVFSKNNGINQVISSGFLVNGGYPISKHSELFWTSAVNYRKNHSTATYRFPKNLNQVNVVLFPNGFSPHVETTNWDVTAITGLRGETKTGWHWKVVGSYGSNLNKRNVSNSNNASQYALGKNAPTSFYLGKLIFKQYINNVSFSKDITQKNGGLRSCNFAIGAEWRIENYRQQEGDEASWEKYDDPLSKIQGGSQPSIGSISYKNLVNKNRTVSGTYIDLELETTDDFLIDISSRFEFYDDFGGNLAGKLAVRYKFSEKFSLRSSVSNGFRAPSMQQRFFEGTQSFQGQDRTSGIFSNNSEITKAFGIPSLQAERSVNLSAGFTSKLSNNISLTVDAYWIKIKNRIVLSGVFRKADNPEVAAVLANYPNIDVVQFYANAINTRTRGIDVVFNGNWNFNKTNVGLILAANFNCNSIFGPIKTTDKISNTFLYTNTLFGIEERTSVEKDQPGKKIILSATTNKGKFGFTLRNTLFGNTASTNIVDVPIDTLYEFFSSKILTDVSISYTSKSWLTITAGVNNILDVYPDRFKNYRLTSEGISLYSNGATPFGSNGGYYYVSMNFNF